MDGKDALLGRFVSQRPYVAHLTTGANAMCESFFATLECQLLERRRFEFVMMATVIAGFWSLMSGTFFLMTLRAAGLLA